MSFDPARRALSNELLFAYSNFSPQKSAWSPLWFFEWDHSTRLTETNRMVYNLTRF
uniref:Uncharacterized protein n=1 Tax=Meloidogyne enterolobii TaxID=390850 RepID=A0A6V7WH40_MELEN|nr:unnamed protein product [Meloidogyne enterolobii]